MANCYAIAHHDDDYALNVLIVLSLQQVGVGQAFGAVLGGLLSIFCNPMNNYWTPMECKIAKAQIGLGEDIMEENIVKEKNFCQKTHLANPSYVWQSMPDGIIGSCESRITLIPATT